MLRLTKDKKIFSDMYEKKELTSDDIWRYVFSEPVESIDGWTFRDLMEFIEPYGMILGEMAWCRFDLFYKEINSKKIYADDMNFVRKIDYISIARNVEIYDGVMTEYADVCGVNERYTDEEIENDETHEKARRYAIEFTPVNCLADLPIKIDDKFQIRKSFTEDPDRAVIYECRKPFYLLDIIWAILWEISFTGTPEDRDKMHEGLDQQIRDIKDGTAELIPAEEVFASLREEFGLEESLGDLKEGLDPKDE